LLLATPHSIIGHVGVIPSREAMRNRKKAQSKPMGSIMTRMVNFSNVCQLIILIASISIQINLQQIYLEKEI